jgi:ornithine carbamoyltransferase
MWQRFTERARRVVFFAQEEAGRLGENYVSTEHLLLGLVREDDSVAARILDRMGVSLGRIRSEIERQVSRGDGRLGQDMQLTPRAKRVIDLAYDEARQLSNNYIGTEHLLLGLIREGEGLAGRVLAKLGVELEPTRREVMALQDNDSSKRTQGAPSVTPSSEGLTRADFQFVIEAIVANEAQWHGKSMVSLHTVSPEQIAGVLKVASTFKAMRKAGRSLYFKQPRTLALLFEKPSLRTRVSFEAGMAHMDGTAIYLAPGDVGLGTRESVPDVAAALSRWVDAIAARVFKHETVELLAANATIPVINALSDREHPVQAFADLMTIQEQKGSLGNHLKLTYIGDGNNVLHALLLACAKVGVNLTAACPDGHGPDPDYVAAAVQIAQASEGGTGAKIEIVTDPAEAVRDADVLYTDVWASMGQENEKEARAKVFAAYQIDAALVAGAKPDAIVLHCLPAHRGEEITDEVMEAHKTVILDQAENRMHTQKALLALMLGL